MNGPFDSEDPSKQFAPVPLEGDPAYMGTPMNLPGGLTSGDSDADLAALASEAAAQPEHDDDDDAGPPGGGDETNIPRS